MRLSEPNTVHTLALYALPPLVAFFGFGVFAALVVTLLVAVAGMALRMLPHISPPDPDLIELHTITYSHYVEKVRWCLDRSGIAYREVPSVGILGILLTGRSVPQLVHPFARTTIGDSPSILRYIWGYWQGKLPPERLEFLRPTPEAIALEKRLDHDLGVHVRCWSYWHLLRYRDLTLRFWGLDEPGIPQWQKTLLPIVHPLLAGMLRRMLDVNDQNAARGLEVTRAAFAEVDALLADGRKYLLGGDELSFVDIAFASLAALIIFPDGYSGGAGTMTRLPVELLPPDWRQEVDALRATAAGQWVENLYATERKKVPGIMK